MPEGVRRPRYTVQEYLRLEEMSNVRHEYLEGEIYAMAGGTPEHARVAANIIAILGSRAARRRCSVFTSDVRVRVVATGLETYPDVTVVCGRLERDPLDEQAVVNPVVVFEVTSPSSEAYDRGEKLRHYQHVPSLQEIVVVSHAGRRVDVWRRQGDGGWTPKAFGPGDVVQLASIDCDLAVDAIDLDPLADD